MFTIALSPAPTCHRILEEFTGRPSLPFLTRADFLEVSRFHQPNAIFLDRDFDGQGRGILQYPELVKLYPNAPIFVLSPHGDYQTLMQALALGAADVIPTPLVKQEVVARFFRRVAERTKANEAKVPSSWEDLTLDPAERVVKCSARHTTLAPVPYVVLEAMVQAKGAVIERQALVARGWKGAAVSSNALDQQIHIIRKSLLDLKSRVTLRAVYGVGFQLVTELGVTEQGSRP